MRKYIQIQTTSICNAKCKICPYVNSYLAKHKAVMTDEVFNRIVSELARIQWEIPKLALYMQNEPLTDPNLEARIEHIKAAVPFKYLEISTNCSLLTAARTEKLIQASKDISFHVELSFHGAKMEQYETMTGLNYDVSVNNVVNFLKAVDPFPNIECRIVSASGFGSLLDVIKDVLGGLTRWPKVKMFNPTTRAGNVQGEFVSATAPPPKPCTRYRNWIHFNWLGDLIMCCNDYENTQLFGNIMDMKLEQLFESFERELPIRLKDPNCICHKCDQRLV